MFSNQEENINENSNNEYDLRSIFYEQKGLFSFSLFFLLFMPESALHLSRKSSGPELEESTTNNAIIGFRTEEFRCEHPAGARCLGSIC